MQQAHDVLAQEDRARAARRAAGGDGAGEADLDDEDTFCDEETCRNTAINALTGAGVTSAFSASSSARQAAHCAKCPSTNSFVSSRSMSSS